MVDSIFKVFPALILASGAVKAGPKLKQQIENLKNSTKIIATQTEVNHIAHMVYLDSLEEQHPQPSEFSQYLRANMLNKNQSTRDTSLDVWLTPYTIVYDKSGKRLRIFSAGPDKLSYSGDEITASYPFTATR